MALFTLVAVPKQGNFNLHKRSSNEACSNGNSGYSLGNAVYYIYSDQACNNYVGSIVTNANGDGTSPMLDKGTYYVRESRAPTGYILSTEVKSVSVPAGGTGDVTVYDKPAEDPVALSVRKLDADGMTSAGLDSNGNATTVGAEFTVKFYAQETDTAFWGNSSSRLADGRYFVESTLLPSDTVSSVSGRSPRLDGSHSLTVVSNGTKDGTNVTIWPTDKNSKAQMWQVITNGDGTRSLKPLHGGNLRLDLYGALTANGSNVDVFTDNGSDAQKWYINKDSDSFQVKSKLGPALDVTNGLITPGANVAVYDANHSAAQKWHFVSTICRVHFDANGGTGTMADEEYAYGEQKALTSCSFRNGSRTFLGWASTKGATKATVLDGSHVYATEVDGNAITLYAVWSGDGHSVDLPSMPTRTWVFKTVQKTIKGKKYAVAGFNEDGSLVSGGAFYKDESGKNCLPKGTFTVQETKAPAGYTLSDSSVHYGQVYQANDAAVQINPVNNWSNKFADIDSGMLAIEDKAKHHSFTIHKVDKETGKAKALGSGTIQGATFTVTNSTPATSTTDGSVNWNGRSYKTGATMTTLTTDANGSCSISNLPAGKYTVRETKAPRGLTPDPTPQVVEFSTSDADGSSKSVTFRDQAIRHDTSFTKRDDWGRPMAGVVFVIRSRTTGEWHVAVTDANGWYSTADHPHGTNTNASDAGVTLGSDGIYRVTDESKVSADNGVWFGGTTAQDGLGALPWDQYDVIELSCSNNTWTNKAGNVTWSTSEERAATDASADHHDATNILNKYHLPFTGSQAAVVLVVAGCAAVVAGVAWYVRRRKN